MSAERPDIDPTTMEVIAWVGADEFDGSRGIKSGRVPAGLVPLAAKGEHESRLRDGHLRAQLQNQANEYNVTIHLVRFRYVEVIETLTPGN